MHVLGIETATASHSAALLNESGVLAEDASPAEGSRGGRLLPMIDAVFKKAGVRPDGLEIVAVSCGPGSFTGLRVGIATAQGLVIGTTARLVGVSTLEVLVRSSSQRDGVVCGLLHAGRGELYTGLFEWRENRLTRLQPDALLVPEAVALFATHDEIHLIGDGAARYRDRLIAAFGGRARFTDEGLTATPSAAVVAVLGREASVDHTKTGTAVTPVYLRRAEAEVNWEKGLVRSPLERLARTSGKGR